jgi:hypothetical protein
LSYMSDGNLQGRGSEEEPIESSSSKPEAGDSDDVVKDRIPLQLSVVLHVSNTDRTPGSCNKVYRVNFTNIAESVYEGRAALPRFILM